jgi:hypothetical protein
MFCEWVFVTYAFCFDFFIAISMNVVQAIEELGSGSGKTKKEIKIVDCGQL